MISWNLGSHDYHQLNDSSLTMQVNILKFSTMHCTNVVGWVKIDVHYTGVASGENAKKIGA